MKQYIRDTLSTIKGSRELFYNLKSNGFLSAGAVNAMFQTEEDKLALKKWREDYDEKNGVGSCDRYMKTCTTRGTLLHEKIEDYLGKGVDVFSDSEHEYASLFGAFKNKFLSNIEYILLEQTVYSKEYKMHGIIDCIGYYDGVLSIIDFKFSTKTKDEHYLSDYKRQLAVYSLILKVAYNINIEQCVLGIGVEGKTYFEPEVQIFKYPMASLVKKLVEDLKDIDYFNFIIGKHKLFKVETKGRVGYDKYDSMVVCANDRHDAKNLTLIKHENWCDECDIVTTQIGTSTDIKQFNTILIESFNAG